MPSFIQNGQYVNVFQDPLPDLFKTPAPIQPECAHPLLFLNRKTSRHAENRTLTSSSSQSTLSRSDMFLPTLSKMHLLSQALGSGFFTSRTCADVVLSTIVHGTITHSKKMIMSCSLVKNIQQPRRGEGEVKIMMPRSPWPWSLVVDSCWLRQLSHSTGTGHILRVSKNQALHIHGEFAAYQPGQQVGMKETEAPSISCHPHRWYPAYAPTYGWTKLQIKTPKQMD